MCAPLKFCGPMLRLAFRNYSVIEQNILSRGEKGTCFQLKIGLSTEAASFCCLASFASSFASNDMVKHVEGFNGF